jgi:hypothetical protein
VERRRAQLEQSVARYLAQLDTADRQEPTEALVGKARHLKEKLVRHKSEMDKLSAARQAPRRTSPPASVSPGQL